MINMIYINHGDWIMMLVLMHSRVQRRIITKPKVRGLDIISMHDEITSNIEDSIIIQRIVYLKILVLETKENVDIFSEFKIKI